MYNSTPSDCESASTLLAVSFSATNYMVFTNLTMLIEITIFNNGLRSGYRISQVDRPYNGNPFITVRVQDVIINC